MRRSRLRKLPRRPAALRRPIALAGLSVVMIALASGEADNAIANGETRTLEIYHTHTKESAAITYKKGGQFDRDALEKLNWLLRDWRRDEPINMDPRLFDIVWEVRKEVGSREPLNIVSAYRAPETNAMLRHRSRAVAKHSQHMLGKAMDFFLPDVSMSDVREVGLRLQRGGVGYYPTAYNPFVHLDAGSVRHWPRMSRDQLARLFPDGKTVHIPSDGKPMPRYDEAAAEIEANGGSVSAYASAGDDDGPGLFSNRKGKSFFAALFGSNDDEDAEFVRGSRRGVAARGQKPSTVVAYAAPNDDGGKLVRDTGLSASPAPYRPSRAFDQQVVRAAPEPQAPVASAAAEDVAVPQTAPLPAAGRAAPVAAPSAAPAPVVADVPVPLQRPVGLAAIAPAVPAAAATPAPVNVASAGPQMVWQQGPAGLGAAEGQVANVPLPLARPSELTRAYASVPVPQPRPIQIASAGPFAPALPPVLGGTAVISAPGAAPVVPASQPPAGPAKPLPAAPLRTAMAPPAEEMDGPLTPGTFDRTGLNALFASATIAPASSHAAAPVNTARTRTAERNLAGVTAKPASAIAMGFGSAPSAELAADHFSGPAVKPLPVTTFVRR